jgi:phosphosulfolactate synthase
MDKRAFDFIELALRSKKPRTQGLTTILDEGEPIPWIRNMLETWGEYVDAVKFALTCLNLPARSLEERVKLYRDFDLKVSLDDPTFAIAYYQGKADQLFRTVREIGFTHVQIETRHIPVNDKEKLKKADDDEIYYYQLARDLGLKAEGEVGQKWPEGDRTRAAHGLLNVEHIINETKRLLELGCEFVFLESLVIREAIGEYGEREEGTEQIRQIMNAVGRDKLFLEIGRFQLPWETRQCHRFWAVRNFGPDVNMGGNEPIFEVPFIEAIRRGFLFVPAPSKSSPRLWVNSMAKNGGRAAEEWWKEEYRMDLSLISQSRS